MKKLFLICTIAILSIALLNAQELEKYSDVIDMIVKQSNILEEYIKGCENVKEAKDVVVLLTKYKDGFKVLIPDLKTLVKNYGPLGELFKDNPPENVKPHLKRMEELSQKLFGASMELGKYKEDPEVKKAQAEVVKVQMEIAQITNPKKEGEEKKE
jgi:hypothetical protein